MSSVGVHQAKTNLSELLRRVAGGEEITITRGGRPVARIVPITPRKSRSLGQDRGLLVVPEDFNDPLPGDLLSDFED
ncbi:MAG: type II toxin-antitoxin system Phd/YefM family antitoxin [Acidimicrobiia bacterium]